jgi:hypothetical protein
MLSKKQRILTMLRQIGTDVKREVCTINHGGCCVYAAEIARSLESIKGVSVEVVAGGDACLTDLRHQFGTLQIPMRELERNGVSFWHVGVRFKYRNQLFTHDTDATIIGGDVVGDDLRFQPLNSGFTVAEAQHLATHGNWNDTFNRKHIPKMAKIIKKHFAQFHAVA